MRKIKVRIYPIKLGNLSVSGIGKAVKHQRFALSENDVHVEDEGDFDLAHVNTYGFQSLAFIKKCKRQGKKVIVHAHSTEEDFRNSFLFSNELSPLYKRWLKYVYNKADLLLTPTPYSKRLLTSYGVKPNIIDISNGIDTTKFQFSEEKRLAFRMNHGFNKQDKLIVSVGLFFRRKGIFDFVELAKKMPKYKFVWCGYLDPRLIQNDTKELLKTKLPNLHFVGYIGDMVSAYSAADVFFMPSYEETEGIVVLEALSMKVPTVVRNIGVYHPWLKGGENCYMGENNSDFENILKDILEHGASNEILEEGYKVAVERDLLKIGEKLKNIYHDLLNDNSIQGDG